MIFIHSRFVRLIKTYASTTAPALLVDAPRETMPAAAAAAAAGLMKN